MTAVKNRKPISKSLRFDIFTRDGYTCRYCGRQSDQVTLHVDHMIPVSKGGTNDPENLITSCADCNLGKSDKMPNHAAPTEKDRLRMAQERNEQMNLAKQASLFIKAKRDLTAELSKYWCSLTGRRRVDERTLKVVMYYIKEFSVMEVFEWIDMAYNKCGDSDKQMAMYISGIRRNLKSKQGDA